MDTPTENRWQFGKHMLEFFPPDYLRQTVVGTLTGEDAEWTVGVCREIAAKHGLAYVLVDMRQGGGANGDARKVLSAATPYAACALVGGNAIMRAVARVITLANAALASNPVPSDFFKTEEEGLAWLDEQRKLKKGTAPKA